MSNASYILVVTFPEASLHFPQNIDVIEKTDQTSDALNDMDTQTYSSGLLPFPRVLASLCPIKGPFPLRPQD